MSLTVSWREFLGSCSITSHHLCKG
uniref:Uncharacterized protein n=1 Tax=Anguilla anguilla TaxID=7936 RepID=A0A0E9Q9V2_ANGAN